MRRIVVESAQALGRLHARLRSSGVSRSPIKWCARPSGVTPDIPAEALLQKMRWCALARILRVPARQIATTRSRGLGSISLHHHADDGRRAAVNRPLRLAMPQAAGLSRHCVQVAPTVLICCREIFISSIRR